MPQQKHPPPQPPGQSRFRYFIWFLLAILILSYFFRSTDQTDSHEISYTAFKDRVKAGRVETITVTGKKLSGSYTDPVDTTTASGDTVSYEAFTSVIPEFEDQNLMAFLERHNVEVTARVEEESWLKSVLLLLLPWILLIGVFWLIRRNAQKQSRNLMGGGGMFGIGKSKAKKYHKSMVDVTFDDVAGLDNAKQDLQEIIDYLKDPDRFTSLGANVPKGLLLTGAPGTGKTLLARGTAGEADVPFFSISGSEFIEMFVGVGASRVRDMFENAKKEAPSIIFIDEIDSIGRARGTGVGGGHDEREQTLNQILSEMDGFEPHESVVVMAATNRPDVLDPALTRPGRFDREITLERPQKEARTEILKIHTRKIPLEEGLDLSKIAARTVGFSGADLQNLANEAALLAGRKKKETVGWEEFDEARDKILLGYEREEMLNDEDRKIIAYHEAGHALVAKSLPDADPIQKVTIIPRGRSLGATEQTPEEDRYNLSKDYILNRITTLLGGRAAERLIFDNMTSGAANDLNRATQIARRMVKQWGMSEEIGPVTFKHGETSPFLGREIAQPKDYSEHTARKIDKEVSDIMKQMESKAEELLESKRAYLEALAEALLEKETLENDEIDDLFEQIDTSNQNDQ